MFSNKYFLSDLAGQLLILKEMFESAQTDVLKNKLPLNSIISKFSELDPGKFKIVYETLSTPCALKSNLVSSTTCLIPIPVSLLMTIDADIYFLPVCRLPTKCPTLTFIMADIVSQGEEGNYLGFGICTNETSPHSCKRHPAV